MSDITDKLCALMSMGYRFVHPRNADGNVVAVTGIRVHHDVIDVLQLYGEHDANAVRMSGSEPDVLSPKSVLWRTSGTPDDVITDLLHLAEPTTAGTAGQPGDSAFTGCWVATRPGRATWLPTSA